MCTTCNCFKHESNDIYYTAFTVILITNMTNKRNHTMITVHHVSQCSSLRYSFSFSHKCPGLVRVHDCNMLALLAPTLRPTRWQQSVSTARRRRRRRNCRRVGWAVARRCERQQRGSQHAGTAVCRTHHCAKSMRANVCIQSYRVLFEGIGATV